MRKNFSPWLHQLDKERASVKLDRDLRTDVAIIGGGAAGLAAGSELQRRRISVTVFDDGFATGGRLASLPDGSKILSRVRSENLRVETGSSVIGCYGSELLAIGSKRASIVHSKHMIFATGTHDGVVAIDGNDLPGVFSARALATMQKWGLTLAAAWVLVGDAVYAHSMDAPTKANLAAQISGKVLLAIEGTSEVTAVRVRDGSKERTVRASAVVFDLPPAPSFELAAQAGAKITFNPETGYVVQIAPDGRAGSNLWAIGEVTGARFDIEDFCQAATTLATSVEHELSRA